MYTGVDLCRVKITVGTPSVINQPNADLSTSVVVDRVRQSPNADIALAHLTEPTTVTPLRLATTTPRRDETLTMAGWGSTTSTDPAPSTQLHWGQMTVGGHTATTMSATGVWPSANTSACPHDSGAPYIRMTPGSEPTLAATESTGPNCPNPGTETTARVDTQITWIHMTVSDPRAGLP